MPIFNNNYKNSFKIQNYLYHLISSIFTKDPEKPLLPLWYYLRLQDHLKSS